MGSPYDVLGIESDADDREVERAYREAVKETHPDHGGTLEEFQLVRTAYERITDGDWTENGEGAFDPEDVSVRTEPQARRVDFLNYEAVEDYGWDLEDPDLFDRAAEANLPPSDFGRVLVEPDQSLLEAAMEKGYRWPYSCRGGACANCAVAVIKGDISMPVDHILTEDLVDRGFRLSCQG
ncbi:2Fe-2S iron-sulfur cluster-binding protein, partial [Haloparvum sedimenti]|uniref:2Fe-2S iron-sulfur cluster-binding protein n=1 Tax=Haloparvum sedimenti TaxID=1678448 RepID=UPI00071E8647